MLKPLERGELDIDYKNYKPGPFTSAPTVSRWDIRIFMILLVSSLIAMTTLG